jgi:SAM-dependent methyltransferase
MEPRQPSRSSDDLKAISETTLGYYNQAAEQFWNGTKDHDVSQNLQAIVDAIDGEGPHAVLDFGCGPGRDLMAFKDMGHQPIGLEGSTELAKLARKHSGCEVLEQNFLELALREAHFDGIFANASFFHVPSQEAPRILTELWSALKERGVLFCSNPRGDNEEDWCGERYSVFYQDSTWLSMVEDVGFTPLQHYFRPAGLPNNQQPWLATVWRK